MYHLYQFKAKLEEIRKTQFANVTPTEITQFMRGTLYVYFDTLFTTKNIYDDSVLKEIQSLIEEFFILIAEWLDMLPQLYLKVWA
jgi:hypothetical protein